ncbi:MAG: dephospho-CoA kinase [Thermoplasmata archaeon]|nr:MAG: dephospho-CoA kinase [Thermoplasmata archaeon]
MKVIAFTGMPCSGKTEAVKVAKKMGIPIVRMGDAVWKEVKNRGLELNDKSVGFIADKMRKEHGNDIWARRTLEEIRSLKKKDCIIIDGIRNVEEVDVLKKELGGDFILIAIDASPETRWRRAQRRGRKDDSKNLKDILERDRRELRWGLGAVIASADIVISNEGSIRGFRQNVEEILKKI